MEAWWPWRVDFYGYPCETSTDPSISTMRSPAGTKRPARGRPSSADTGHPWLLSTSLLKRFADSGLLEHVISGMARLYFAVNREVKPSDGAAPNIVIALAAADKRAAVFLKYNYKVWGKRRRHLRGRTANKVAMRQQ